MMVTVKARSFAPRRLTGLAFLLLLNGCGADYRVFHPQGAVASSEYYYTLLITLVMMLIIAPTTIALCVFAWRYRKSAKAAYDPSFSHSLALELGMWGVPLIIVVALAFAAYASVFAVNPTGPVSLAIPAPDPQPGVLKVDVITTDWQWIFVYPDQHIATIDDLVVPQGVNVQLELTSATVLNDFYIPQVAAMIDVMPGMRTQDAFRVDAPGNYEGFSADFSGAGFSWMQFSTRILSSTDFAAWVKQTQAEPDHLDYAKFQQLAQPTINEGAKPSYFSSADPMLFSEVYNAVRNGQVYPVPASMDAKAAETPANPAPGAKVKS